MPIFFNNNLKILRKRKALTQEGLSIQMGKARNTINNWEKGVSEPSLKEVLKLCNILDVSSDSLLFVDLTNVQISENSIGAIKHENVRGNVQSTVLSNGKNSDLDSLKRQLKDKQETLEALKLALDSKNDLNSSLNNTISMLSAEIDRLKRDNSELQATIDGHSGRGGQKKSA